MTGAALPTPLMVVVSVVGALLVLGALRDVFLTLWHPSGQGRLSGYVSTVLWRAARRIGPRAQNHAGPAVLVAVIVVWGSLVVVGCALVYWPWVPEAFVYGSGVPEGRWAGALDALYVSAVVLGTLGFGDIVPASGVLRLVAAGEALVGFGLLTAGMSWVQQITPALQRRRSLAGELDALARSARAAGSGAEHDEDGDEDEDDAHGLPPLHVIDDLVRSVVAVRVDLWQHAQTYYFRDSDPSVALDLALPIASRVAHRACTVPSHRDAGRRLGVALDLLAELLAEQHVPGEGDRDAVFRRYAADQAR
ncbi:potassium channel family protein [Sanguibacter suaedae]|nr:potassium channel family protein [Sanguibacter suaedae]